jgi:hypothetical protein
MIVANMIAGIGVMLDQPILIVELWSSDRSLARSLHCVLARPDY